MRQLIFFLFGVLLLVACSENSEQMSVPQSLSVKEKNNQKENTTTQTKEIAPKSKVVPTIKKPQKEKKAAPKQKKKPKPKIQQADIEEEIVDLTEEAIHYIPNEIPESEYPYYFSAKEGYLSDGFDFPVGKPDAVGYYKSQNFGDRLHLGEDWNGNRGGNTDFGDPVYASANGLVTFVQDVCCGWGNTIRIIHYVGEDSEQPYVESLYSHLHTMHVDVGQLVKRGQQIGTIGTAEGRYVAHLHFEMRDFINMSIGPGYSDDQQGYLDPTPYIKQHRPLQ